MVQAYRGEVAAKEQHIKEIGQAGKVALLEGKVASSNRAVQVSKSKQSHVNQNTHLVALCFHSLHLCSLIS